MYRGKVSSILFQILAILLILVIVYSVVRILQQSPVEPREDAQQISKTVVADGVEYFPRQDIDVLLVMGIDKYGPVQSSGAYNNDGEADTVLLVIFDHAEGCIRVLNVNRDTMVRMPVLGIGGKQAGTYYGQLALSHTYGSGLEDSCENTRNTVSELLGGISIDYYVAMHMDAIGILNDAVGGVSVMVTDDFSAYDSNIPLGQTVLRGQQAIDFVRYREDVGDELNTSRMERQLEYIDGFFPALHGKLQTQTGFVVQAYEDVSEYIVTDCSSTILSSMLERYGDYNVEQVASLPGESRRGEEFMEFYPDEDALKALILELFYAPK